MSSYKEYRAALDKRIGEWLYEPSKPQSPEFIEGFEQRAEQLGDITLTVEDVVARQKHRDQIEAVQVARTITGKRRYLPKPRTAYEAQRQAKMTGKPQ